MSKSPQELLESAKSRFKTKVIDKAAEYFPNAWKYTIHPLEVVAFDGKTLTVYSDNPYFVSDHYGDALLELLNDGLEKKLAIEFTNQKEG